MALGDRGAPVRTFVDDVAHAMFGVIALIVKAAPIGAFGAMAYTIGRYDRRLSATRRLDRDLLSDGGRLCVPCIGNNRLVRRLLDLKISPVHQG